MHRRLQHIHVDRGHLQPHVGWEPVPRILPLPGVRAPLATIAPVDLATKADTFRLNFLHEAFQWESLEQLLFAGIIFHMQAERSDKCL